MSVRISVRLLPEELGALADLAKKEHRDTRDQAGMLIRLGLEARGYLREDRDRRLQQAASQQTA